MLYQTYINVPLPYPLNEKSDCMNDEGANKRVVTKSRVHSAVKTARAIGCPKRTKTNARRLALLKVNAYKREYRSEAVSISRAIRTLKSGKAEDLANYERLLKTIENQ